MADEIQQQAAEQGAHGAVKLPPFWPHAPVAWFVQAEAVLHLKRVTDSMDRYCHVLAGLPQESLRMVLDIAENPPEEDPYTAIKDRLMCSHQLSDYQRLDKLYNMPGLGAEKPSTMMAAMLELVPRGEEKSKMFSGLFLQRLPRELRILLTQEDLTDMKALAVKADALHTHRRIDSTVAAVEHLSVSEDSVAAISGQHNKSARGRGRCYQDKKKQDNKGEREPEQSRQARLAAGLCILHWRHGDRAWGCKGSCSWAGNGQAGGN
jgi:hypothetical protein